MSNEIKHLTNHDPEKWIMRFDEKGAIHVNPKYDHVGATSDGYHTFDELYEHRIALFKCLCWYREESFWEGDVKHKSDVWKSLFHSDGSCIEGWFIAGIGHTSGSQITYHIPLKEWGTWPGEKLDKAPEWDGHSASDVLKRLAEL